MVLGEQKRLVLVDGNIAFCGMLQEYLAFYSEFKLVGVFHSGLEAARECPNLLPDIIVMDNSVPFLDGLNLLKIFQKSLALKKPVIIMLTAFSQENVARRALELGADCFMVKPLGINNLVHTMQQLLKGDDSLANTKISKVEAYLISLGLDSRLQGFRYCVDGVILLFDISPRSASGLGKYIYQELSKAYSKSVASIERSMRYAIANRTGSNAIVDSRQTNVAFIYSIYRLMVEKDVLSELYSER
jgi:CheY-like chemotaxis protein